MKVEYPLQLFQSFNKRIWNNKPFSYFLIAFVIGYTIFLRSLPELYYKYMMNPVILTIIITGIMIISINNLQLGLLLIVSLIALYYPKQKYNEMMIEENFDNQTLPIDKYDKNIVDEKKKSTTKDTKTTKKKNKLEEDFEDEEDAEDAEDVEDDTEDTKDTEDVEDDAEDDTKDEEDVEDDEEDENKISEMRLENLNPSLYKKKASEKDKSKSKSSNNTTTTKTNKVVEKLTDLKKESKSSGNEETFLGEVRQIVKDLDTGKNKMNATSAIKKISNLMYHKHKGDIQKIINTEESEEEDDDEDLY